MANTTLLPIVKSLGENVSFFRDAKQFVLSSKKNPSAEGSADRSSINYKENGGFYQILEIYVMFLI